MREHGTSACYRFGPGDGPGGGCRCAPCTAASRGTSAQRRRQIAYGRWQPYVDAGPARAHLAFLSASGIGWMRAATLSGVPRGAVSKIIYGGPGDRPPSRRIRPETEAKILAVQPSLELLAGRADVSATGTRRRIQALVARGWSMSKLAARLGMYPTNLGKVLTRPVVSAATARAVAKLYAELQFTGPPEAGHRDKIAATRARKMAAARGWAPPAAWDDIDDPHAVPEGWQRPAELPMEDIAAEARDLAELGLSRQAAADRIGVTQQRVTRALRLHPDEPLGGAA